LIELKGLRRNTHGPAACEKKRRRDGSGVGRSIALCLSGEGVNVVISDIAMDKAENAAGECRALGVKAYPVRTDLSQAKECVQRIDRAEELLGPVDILVNNAGIWPTNLVVDIPVEEWRKTFDVNLTPCFLPASVSPRRCSPAGGRERYLTSSYSSRRASANTCSRSTGNTRCGARSGPGRPFAKALAIPLMFEPA